MSEQRASESSVSGSSATLHSPSKEAVRARPPARGLLGVVIITLCSTLMGSGALYQALRVHQRQAGALQLDQAARSLSKLSQGANTSLDSGLQGQGQGALEVMQVTPRDPSSTVELISSAPYAAFVALEGVAYSKENTRARRLESSKDKPWFDAYWSSRARWRDAEGASWAVSPHPLPREVSASALPARWVIRQLPPDPPEVAWGRIALAALATLLLSLSLTPLLERSRWVGGVTPLTALPLCWVLSDLLTRREAIEGLEVEGALLVLLSAALPMIALGVSQLWTRGRRSSHRVAYLYMAPTLVSVGVLVFVPFTLGVLLAFTRHHQGNFEWVGLAHFIDILSASGRELTDPLNFYFTLGVTLLWTISNVILHLSIGLALALLLNLKGLRLTGFYRALLIVPWAIPNYITALIWKGMFNHQYGMINGILEGLGITPVNWLGSFWGAMAANVTTNTWLGFPFMMVVALGALQSIPTDLYEAARIAGASRWVQFKEITLPLLKPALLPAVILGSVWTFNMFNIIYLVSGGQPVGATDILITEAYRWAFEQDRYGYAAAYSLVIFFILLGYAGLTQRISRSAEEVYR